VSIGLALAMLVAGCDASVVPAPSTTAADPTPTPTSTTLPTPTPSPSPSPKASPAVLVIPPCPGTIPEGHPIGAALSGRSTNWSGMVGILAGTRFTCVEATWVQPEVRCHGLGDQSAAYWVGLGGYDEKGLVQIGTESICLGGLPVTRAWRQSLPRQRYTVGLGMDIRVGHKIHAQVRWLGGPRYRLTLVDLDSKESFTIDDTNSKIHRTSADWIAEAPTAGCPSHCRIQKMPEFETFTFLSAWATVAGRRVPVDGTGFTHVKIAMETSGGAARAEVTSLASNGTSFKVRWRRP